MNENKISYICLAEAKYDRGRGLCFQFLYKVKERFLEKYNYYELTNIAYSLDKKFKPVLKEVMVNTYLVFYFLLCFLKEFYNSPQADKGKIALEKLNKIKDVMLENV